MLIQHLKDIKGVLDKTVFAVGPGEDPYLAPPLPFDEPDPTVENT